MLLVMLDRIKKKHCLRILQRKLLASLFNSLASPKIFDALEFLLPAHRE
jgi:hypothetical protein